MGKMKEIDIERLNQQIPVFWRGGVDLDEGLTRNIRLGFAVSKAIHAELTDYCERNLGKGLYESVVTEVDKFLRKCLKNIEFEKRCLIKEMDGLKDFFMNDGNQG